MSQLEKKLVTNRRKSMPDWKYRNCDAQAMCIALNDDVILESFVTYACVELDWEKSRGQMVLNSCGYYDKPNNIKIVTKLDKEMYLFVLRQTLAEK